jgi:hypothetical protein
MQLHRNSGGDWRLGDLPLLLARRQGHGWRIIPGGPGGASWWSDNLDLAHTEFDTRRDAYRAVIAEMAHRPLVSTALRPYRTVKGQTITADGHWRIARYGEGWGLYPYSDQALSRFENPDKPIQMTDTKHEAGVIAPSVTAVTLDRRS